MWKRECEDEKKKNKRQEKLSRIKGERSREQERNKGGMLLNGKPFSVSKISTRK